MSESTIIQRGAGRQTGNSDFRKGFSIAAFGVFMLSWDAVFVRLADVSSWDAAFWRGAFIAVSLSCYLLVTGDWKKTRQLFSYGWIALLVCGLYGFNTFLFVAAISHTSIANAVVILSITPVFSALFSWWMLREKIPVRTWIVMAFAVAGVGTVFIGSLNISGNRGDLLALLLAMATGLLFTVLRRHPDLPRIPAVAVGAAASAICLFPLSNPLSVGATSLGWLAVMGLLQKPLASVCMLIATRYLPAAEVSLFFLLEAVLAPLWAWMILSETPSLYTLAGGTIVLLTMAGHAWFELKRDSSGTTDTQKIKS